MEPVPFGQAGPRDLEVMQDQSQWPLTDILCLKRYKNRTGGLDDADFGFLMPIVEDLKIAIFDRDTKKVYEYDSIEELVADGWIVD